VGQVASDLGKTTINSILGTGNKPTVGEQIQAIGTSAAKTAGNTALGEAIGNVPALFRGVSKGFFLDLTYGKAKELWDSASDAMASLKDYYTLIGNQKSVKPSIPELLPQQGQVRMVQERAYKSDEALTAEEESRINSNLDTLAYNYKNF